MVNNSTLKTDLSPPYLIYFGDVATEEFAKTGLGLIEWCRSLCAGQLRHPSCGVNGGIPDLTLDEAVSKGVKSVIIGVAPAGGSIPDSWVADLADAVRRGCDLVSGMHVKLRDFPEIVAAQKESGARLVDVRVPPKGLKVGTGEKRSGNRLLTVGTDCAVGKMYTALAIEKEMLARGWSADFRATGQTGIMIAGRGMPIDSVVSDFISGAAEMISPSADVDHWDVIEGQGALTHPSFAGVSLGLLHGSQPDALVLCHDASRTHIFGLGTSQPYPLLSLSEVIRVNLEMARRVNPCARFVGVSVNSSALSAEERAEALAEYEAETGLPVVDPIIDGAAKIVDRIIGDYGFTQQRATI